jgi:ribosome recycling factor
VSTEGEELIQVALADCRERMHKAVDHAKADFATVRTGRATPALVEKLRVDYYGSETPLQQLAGFSVPEPRVLVVSPYDKGAMKAIERAISASDLGINPSNDGSVIRLVFPELTTERRKDLVRVLRHRGEEARIVVRNVRRASRHELEALEKEGDLSSDELDRAEKELEKVTHEMIADVERLLAAKEKELLEL